MKHLMSDKESILKTINFPNFRPTAKGNNSYITALDFVDDKVFKLKVKPLYHYQNCYIDEKTGTPDSIEPYVEELTRMDYSHGE